MKCFGILLKQFEMREWLSGRALPCQGKCREFESRLPLQIKISNGNITYFFVLFLIQL